MKTLIIFYSVKLHFAYSFLAVKLFQYFKADFYTL